MFKLNEANDLKLLESHVLDDVQFFPYKMFMFTYLDALEYAKQTHTNRIKQQNIETHWILLRLAIARLQLTTLYTEPKLETVSKS